MSQAAPAGATAPGFGAAVTKARLEAFSYGCSPSPSPCWCSSCAHRSWTPADASPRPCGTCGPATSLLVSFLTIGMIWLNHYWIFEQVVPVDGPLLLNLNLLLWAALLPFPTAVVAEYLRAGGEAAQTAAALYTAILLIFTVTAGSPERPRLGSLL